MASICPISISIPSASLKILVARFGFHIGPAGHRAPGLPERRGLSHHHPMSIFSAISKGKPPRFIRSAIDSVEATAEAIAQSAKDDAAEGVGYAARAGARYPPKAYHLQVSPTLTPGSPLDHHAPNEPDAHGLECTVHH